MAGLDGKAPVMASLFGDLFMEGAAGYWYLDIVEGTLTPRWDTSGDLHEALSTPEGEERYLLGRLAMDAAGAGIALSPTQVYDFTVPPCMGGRLEVANLKAMDFVVALDLAGQIHEQVRRLPPGTKTSGVTISRP
jgi:hypothetical protein